MNLNNLPGLLSTAGQITNSSALQDAGQAFQTAVQRFDGSNALGSMVPTASGVFNIFNQGELSEQVDRLMTGLTSGQLKPEDFFGALEAAGFPSDHFLLAPIVEFLPQVLGGRTGVIEGTVKGLISSFLQQHQGALAEVLSLLNGPEQANEILDQNMRQSNQHPLVPGSGPQDLSLDELYARISSQRGLV
ncbi:MAG: hypothetical protein ACXIVD_05955 [Salinarimonas sp.]